MVYRIKPIITNSDEIILPKCMYKVKSIHGWSPGVANVGYSLPISQNLDLTEQLTRMLKLPILEMAELEKRQMKLLQQLDKLHSQVHVLKTQLKNNVTNTQKKAGGEIKPNFPDDVVLSVDPNNPLFSLIMLRNLLRSYVNMKITFYIHSSTPGLPERASQFEKSFNIAGSKDNTSLATLNIHLIWKENIDDATLTLSPIAAMPIRGESNILRYFASSIPNDALLKNGIKSVIDENAALDLCYILRNQSVSGKNKLAAAKQIVAKLNACTWLCGNVISIADLALYSVMQNVNLSMLKNPFVQRWTEQCARHI